MVSVSVALCTRNGARFIEEQFHSILGQTRPVDEIVVSDDASTDGTVEIVRAVLRAAGSEAPSLTVLQNPEPLGVTRNFEQAVLACSSEFVALCDQDDIWHPDRIAEALSIFHDRPQLLLVHSNAALVDAGGRPLGPTLFEALEVAVSDILRLHAGDAFSVLLRRNLVTGATVLLRRTLAEAAAPFPPEWVHDEWLAIVAAAWGGIDVAEACLIDYRQHLGNEIGMAMPTLRQRISRVTEPGGGRNAAIARRFETLRNRLQSSAWPVSVRDLEKLDLKIAHEAARAALPRIRVLRVAGILAERSRYAPYSSRGRLDMLRDLLQPR